MVAVMRLVVSSSSSSSSSSSLSLLLSSRRWCLCHERGRRTSKQPNQPSDDGATSVSLSTSFGTFRPVIYGGLLSTAPSIMLSHVATLHSSLDGAIKCCNNCCPRCYCTHRVTIAFAVIMISLSITWARTTYLLEHTEMHCGIYCMFPINHHSIMRDRFSMPS